MSASVASLTTTNLDDKSRGKVTRLSFPITIRKVESRIPRNTARIQNEEEDGRGGGAGQSRNVVQTKIGKAESDGESGGKDRHKGIKKKEHETKTETWEHRQEQAVLPSST